MSETQAPQARYHAESAALILSGDLDGEGVEQLNKQLQRLSLPTQSRLSVELNDLELNGATALNRCIDLIRQLQQQHQPLILIHAPHHLAHVLYRIGALQQGLELHKPREEEPYG